MTSMTEEIAAKQQFSILIHSEKWRNHGNAGYKSVGPFSNYDVAKRWLNDHKPDYPHDYLIVIIPITASSKAAGLY